MDETNIHPSASTNAQTEQYAESSTSSTDSAFRTPYTSTRNYSGHREEHSKSTLRHAVPPNPRSSAFGGIFDDALRTAVNNEDDVFMAETWSTPTHVGSDCDDTGGCAMWETFSSPIVPEIYISPPSPSLDGTAGGDFEEEAIEASNEPLWIGEDCSSDLQEQLIPIGSYISDELYQVTEAKGTRTGTGTKDSGSVMSSDRQLMPSHQDLYADTDSQAALSEDSHTLLGTVYGSVLGSEMGLSLWDRMSGTTRVSEADPSVESPQHQRYAASSSILYDNRSRDMHVVRNKTKETWSLRSRDGLVEELEPGGCHASKMGNNNVDIGCTLMQHHGRISKAHGSFRRPRQSEQRDRKTCATVCVCCGSVFSGPRHRIQTLDHIQLVHIVPGFGLKSPVTPKPQDKVYSNFDGSFKNNTFTNASLTSDRGKASLIWQDQLRHELSCDLKDVGTKWYDETRSRRARVESFTVATVLVESTRSSSHPDSDILMNQIRTLVNSKDAEVDPERINDFFNGLEIVAQDLAHQSPNRNVSHAIQDIMSTVQRKMGTSKTLTLGSAHVPATTHISTRTCPAAAQNTSYRSSGSVATPNSGQQLSTTNGLGCSSNLRSPSLRNGQRQNLDIAVQDSRVQRPEGRRLACHVRKNDEVHGRVPSCSFKGAGAMSALRIHLTCRDHSRDLHFIRHCRNCSEYVIDESDWCNRHEGMLCTMKKQSRGDAEVVRQWRELYEKMFPDSNRIPHPYIGNCTWIPKTHSLRRVSNSSSATQEHHDFDFNNPPTPHSTVPNTTSILPSQAAIGGASSQQPSSPNLPTTTRDLLFEPSLSLTPYQPRAFHPETTTYRQAFLDQPDLTAHGAPLCVVTLRGQVPGMSVVTTTRPSFPGRDDGAHAVSEDEWTIARQQETTTPMDSQQGNQARLGSQDLEYDRTRTALLQTILDLLEAYTQHDNISMSSNLAHRIAHIHSLSPQECEVMHTDLLDRVMSTTEQLRFQTAAPSMAHMTPTPQPPQASQSTDGFSPRHSARSSDFEDNPRTPPLRDWETDAYTPATLEHVDTWHSDEFLTRLAARSLDELTLPVYVPTSHAPGTIVPGIPVPDNAK